MCETIAVDVRLHGIQTEPARVQNSHSLAALQAEPNVVRHYHDGPAVVGESPEEGDEKGGGLVIQAGERLVGEQEPGAVQQGAGDGQPLEQAAGENAGSIVPERRQGGVVEQLFHAGGGLAHPMQSGRKSQILPDGQLRIKIMLACEITPSRLLYRSQSLRTS